MAGYVDPPADHATSALRESGSYMRLTDFAMAREVVRRDGTSL